MQISSPLTPNGIAYAWCQLLTRAGVSITDGLDLVKRLGISVHYGSYVWGDPSSARCVRVMPCADDAWQSLLAASSGSLDWLPISRSAPAGVALPWNDPAPVLFWSEVAQGCDKPFAEYMPDGSVVFYVDIVAAAFFMLSRWEETVVPIRDPHDRFPATASVAYRQGFLDRPIVDEYALILREWLKVVLPGWKPKPCVFSVKLSHDIDHIYQFQNWYAAVYTVGGDLLRRRSPMRAWRTVRDALAQVVLPAQTDYVRRIYYLADLSREYGLDNDAFYFMADGPDRSECGYAPKLPVVSRCIKDLRERGFEIGLHPGYDTFQNPERLAEEKARLDAILGETRYGGRQHFLRFQAPDTWRHWEQVGMTYDSTLTYADHEGFRCGTCYPFRPFDVGQNRELDLWEVPLIVMDGTLRDYRKLTAKQGEMRVLELAQRCRHVGGTFTLLWHNSSLDGEWRPWGEMYQRVTRSLAGMQGGMRSRTGVVR
jgi:hypothetical protein